MEKPLTPFGKIVLGSAGGLAVLAGPALYFWPEYTSIYFAWTIKHPLTPVFMGASYLAGMGVFLILLENRWSLARVQLPAIITFAIMMLWATLLHLPAFNWQHPIAWAWLIVYILSPFAGLWLFWRSDKGYKPKIFPNRLPKWVSPVSLSLSLITAIIGLVLFFFPAYSDPYWPWTLTPLTSRVIGGWFLAEAALLFMLSRQKYFETARVALIANLIVVCLLLLGAWRWYSSFNGPSWATGLYLLRLAVSGGMSLAALLFYARRLKFAVRLDQNGSYLTAKAQK